MKAAKLAPGAADRPRHIQILDEAARMINARGVSSKPLSDLAERLNLSRAALYYYVKDREDLVFQVYRRTCDILHQALAGAMSAGPDTMAVVQTFIALALDPDAPDLSVLAEMGLLRPDDREIVQRDFEKVVGRLAGLLAQGQTRGEIRSCDVSIAARTIVSIVISVPANARWAISAQGPDIGDRRRQIALAQDMLTLGWLADRSQVLDPAPVNLDAVALAKVDAFDREALAKARRDAILVAASGLFNRKGVDSTSLDEIALAVGATKRTLYQLVGDKMALTLECARRTGQIFRYVFFQVLDGLEGGDPTAEAVVRWQRSLVMAQLRRDVEPVRGSGGMDALTEDTILEVRDIILKDNQARQDLLFKLQASGQMRRFGELSLVGPPNIWWNSMNWLNREDVDEAQRARIAAEVVEVLSLGLRAL